MYFVEYRSQHEKRTLKWFTTNEKRKKKLLQLCFGNLNNADMATLGCSASLTHQIGSI
jgi:hypothetical protein